LAKETPPDIMGPFMVLYLVYLVAFAKALPDGGCQNNKCEPSEDFSTLQMTDRAATRALDPDHSQCSHCCYDGDCESCKTDSCLDQPQEWCTTPGPQGHPNGVWCAAQPGPGPGPTTTNPPAPDHGPCSHCCYDGDCESCKTESCLDQPQGWCTAPGPQGHPNGLWCAAQPGPGPGPSTTNPPAPDHGPCSHCCYDGSCESCRTASCLDQPQGWCTAPGPEGHPNGMWCAA